VFVTVTAVGGNSKYPVSKAGERQALQITVPGPVRVTRTTPSPPKRAFLKSFDQVIS
jgi:hypothetical protein